MCLVRRRFNNYDTPSRGSSRTSWRRAACWEGCGATGPEPDGRTARAHLRRPLRDTPLHSRSCLLLLNSHPIADCVVSIVKHSECISYAIKSDFGTYRVFCQLRFLDARLRALAQPTAVPSAKASQARTIVVFVPGPMRRSCGSTELPTRHGTTVNCRED